MSIRNHHHMTSDTNSIINTHSISKDNLSNTTAPASKDALKRKYDGWRQDELIMEFYPEEVFSHAD